VKEFYLLIFFDFRGRLYPLSNYLSYQGNDLARSLILFADGEILNEEALAENFIFFRCILS
jgi:DNA-directed RNA polymerase